jgi:hAT family protein
LQELNPSKDQRADEWTIFQAGGPLKIECSPLSWWLQPQQQQNWPCLANMAVDVLSIPAMSDEPERIFSGGRRTVSWERMRLGEQTIQAAECLKSWFREDFF